MSRRVSGVAPPGWPAQVPPPGAPGWERRATGWLFDLCPADLRAHDVLHRYPVVLAYLAERHVRAALDATTAAVATMRADLRDQVAPEALGRGAGRGDPRAGPAAVGRAVGAPGRRSPAGNGVPRSSVTPMRLSP